MIQLKIYIEGPLFDPAEACNKLAEAALCCASPRLTFLLSRTHLEITKYITSFVVHIPLDLELALVQNLEKGESSGRLKQHQHLQPSHNSTHLSPI